MEVIYCTRVIAIFLMGLWFFAASAQTESSDSLSADRSFKPNWEFSGFVDAYYAADLLDNTPNKAFQPFLFNHNRNREFQLNLAMLKVAATSDYYRAVVHLQTGTYAFDNYAAEPTLYQTIYEAYAGIALNRRQTSWLDFGVFESHIGYESAISMQNYTLTRSLMAENSPYFLTGARLTFEPSENWLFRVVLSNGWQQIERPNEQKWPAIGTQVEYKWGDGYTANWSTFWGGEFPSGERRERFYNNLFIRRDMPSQISWVLGFDMGFQEDLAGADETHSWYTANALISYPIASAWRMALRAERYRDADASLIGPDFSAWAGSVNFDYQPVSQVALRFELKYLYSDLSGRAEQSQLMLTTSIAAEIGG
jgi:hypothetical protein